MFRLVLKSKAETPGLRHGALCWLHVELDEVLARWGFAGAYIRGEDIMTQKTPASKHLVTPSSLSQKGKRRAVVVRIS